MEQIVSGITNGNGYISYIFREQTNSPKKKESNLNLSIALSQNNINDCHLLSNERRRSAVYDDIKKRLNISTPTKSPLSPSPESAKSPYRNMTSCEIPNMDIWGGVLVDSQFSQRLRNKASSVMESPGSSGLGGGVINNNKSGLTRKADYYSTSDINRSSSRSATNRHFLRLNTNISNSPSIINSAVEERNPINPRYYSIVNINGAGNGSINTSDENLQDSSKNEIVVSPLNSKAYSKSVSQINDDNLYSNAPIVKQNSKAGVGKVKTDNRPLQRSNSNGFSNIFGKKKNRMENSSPLSDGSNSPMSPLNPNYPSALNPHKRASSAFSIPVTLSSQPNQPSNLNRIATANIPEPLSKESKQVSKSVNINTSPLMSKSSGGAEIFSEDFQSSNDLNTPDDGLPNFEEIEQWHLIHKPSKTVRSTRLSFNKSTATSKPPYTLFQNLCWALYEMKNVYPNRFYFVRNPDFYLFECHLLEEDLNSISVKFEVEVCKVWLLKLYALRLKRISGSPFLYEELYNELMSLLKTDEEVINRESTHTENEEAETVSVQ